VDKVAIPKIIWKYEERQGLTAVMVQKRTPCGNWSHGKKEKKKKKGKIVSPAPLCRDDVRKKGKGGRGEVKARVSNDT